MDMELVQQHLTGFLKSVVKGERQDTAAFNRRMDDAFKIANKDAEKERILSKSERNQMRNQVISLVKFGLLTVGGIYCISKIYSATNGKRLRRKWHE